MERHPEFKLPDLRKEVKESRLSEGPGAIRSDKGFGFTIFLIILFLSAYLYFSNYFFE